MIFCTDMLITSPSGIFIATALYCRDVVVDVKISHDVNIHSHQLNIPGPASSSVSSVYNNYRLVGNSELYISSYLIEVCCFRTIRLGITLYCTYNNEISPFFYLDVPYTCYAVMARKKRIKRESCRCTD